MYPPPHMYPPPVINTHKSQKKYRESLALFWKCFEPGIVTHC